MLYLITLTYPALVEEPMDEGKSAPKTFISCSRFIVLRYSSHACVDFNQSDSSVEGSVSKCFNTIHIQTYFIFCI